METEHIRRQLVETLRLDLIGPDNDHAFANELLPESPTRWYLTGLLVPTDAPIAQKFDETSTEQVDSPAEPGGLDDADQPDKPAARKSLLPSSMGLSVLVPASTKTFKAAVMWGDYIYESADGKEEPAETTEAKVAGKEAAAEKTGQETAPPRDRMVTKPARAPRMPARRAGEATAASHRPRS